MLAYAVYNYAYYVFGMAFNDVFLLHVALFSAALFALVLALAQLDVAGTGRRFATGTPARLVGGYPLLVAAGLGGMWSWFSPRSCSAACGRHGGNARARGGTGKGPSSRCRPRPMGQLSGRQPEGRVLVGDQRERVPEHAVVPADDPLDEV